MKKAIVTGITGQLANMDAERDCWEPKCTLEALCDMMVKADLRRNEAGSSF